VKLTAKKCSLMYIGNGMSFKQTTVDASDLKVKIEATQTQSEWGNSDHLGASGDCGFTEATRDDATGNYSFKLKHKAAYLVFQPYKPSAVPDDVILLKIEIVTDGTTTLAGEYPFGTGELGTGTNTSNTVTLLCDHDGYDNSTNPGGFALGTSASAANSCFAVIQPGQHSLTIRYTYFMPQRYYVGFSIGDNGYARPGYQIVVTKKITTIPNYAANSVTTIRHEIGPLVFPSPKYYQWGASSTSGSYDSTTLWPNQLEMTSPVNWAALPNVNELSWYIEEGDIYINGCNDDENLGTETGTYWIVEGDDYSIYGAGAWIKKRQYIPNFSSEIGANGTDLRLDNYAVYYKYSHRGRPNDDVIDQYFYLPCIGPNDNRGGWGLYWTKSTPKYSDYAYQFSIDYQYGVSLSFWSSKRYGISIVVPDWFQ
ncbi:MAG: hypothetical protein IKX94_04440, partial [Muribaculaceae bacterium]|nr:hypothetical protein [Muribaculaceae bacterium]